MLDSNDIKMLKNTFDFWDHLTDTQKELLIANTNTISYPKGTILHNGDNECMGVLITKSGRLRTFLLSDEGREVTLYRLDPGEVCVIASTCLLHTITFDVHIEAETDCEIIQVNPSALTRLSEENVYVELFSYKVGTERFSDVMWAMQQILFLSFDKRLAGFLLDESLKTNSLVIKITHEQIAKHLGSAREVVSRMLKHFSTEGAIKLFRGGIEIIDKEKLKSYL